MRSFEESGIGIAAGHWPEDHRTFDDYLALEERSELRHEFVAGSVIVMSGGTRAHDQAAFYLARRPRPEGMCGLPAQREARRRPQLLLP